MSAARQSFAFHAAAPAGEWLNDPNALIFAGGKYRLYAQHRADRPEFKATGWAVFSSTDLLSWKFGGVAIPPAGDEWYYSGSISGSCDKLALWHTVHNPTGEHQACRTSNDGGKSWSAASTIPPFDKPAKDVRDPFVFEHDGVQYMLLARPCGWHSWNDDAPSIIGIYSCNEANGEESWHELGQIGPWCPRGIIWEVPVIATIDGYEVLFISSVDRRSGGAICEVRCWIGRFSSKGFAVNEGTPHGGQLVDIGPDFYALMKSCGSNWPLDAQVFVGWLSSWQTARAVDWCGSNGGPISLPRAFSVSNESGKLRLHVIPAPSVLKAFCNEESFAGSGLCSFVVNGDAQVRISVRSGQINADFNIEPSQSSIVSKRSGQNDLVWNRNHRYALQDIEQREVLLFIDLGVLELFLPNDGLSISMALGGSIAADDVEIEVSGNTYRNLEWRSPSRSA